MSVKRILSAMSTFLSKLSTIDRCAGNTTFPKKRNAKVQLKPLPPTRHNDPLECCLQHTQANDGDKSSKQATLHNLLWCTSDRSSTALPTVALNEAG